MRQQQLPYLAHVAAMLAKRVCFSSKMASSLCHTCGGTADLPKQLFGPGQGSESLWLLGWPPCWGNPVALALMPLCSCRRS